MLRINNHDISVRGADGGEGSDEDSTLLIPDSDEDLDVRGVLSPPVHGHVAFMDAQLHVESSGSSVENHCHVQKKPSDRRAVIQLVIVSFLCFLFMGAEIAGGLISGSLAIATDATHMACDLAGFLVSLFAIWIAKKPATSRMSFGFYRAEVIGALVSILIIWQLTGVLVYLAARRIYQNGYNGVEPNAMLLTASIGVAFNVVMGLVLHGKCVCCKDCSVHSFSHGHSHGVNGHSHGASGHSHDASGHSHDTGGHSHNNSGHYQNNHSHSHGHNFHSHSPIAHSNDSHSHDNTAHLRLSSGHDRNQVPTDGAAAVHKHQDIPRSQQSGFNRSNDCVSSAEAGGRQELLDSTEQYNLSQIVSLHTSRNFEPTSDVIVDYADPRRGSSHNEGCDDGGVRSHATNINVRAAMVHVIGDLFQSIGVLVAAIIIKVRPEYKIADPICTFIFSFLVICTTVSVLRDIFVIIMQGTPRDLDYKSMKKDLERLDGIKMVHSLNVWSLTMDKVAVGVHLAVGSDVLWPSVLTSSTSMLRRKYGVHQTTIQVEDYDESTMSVCRSCHEP